MNKVRTGVSRICITPPLNTPLSGYYEPRYATGVHDDLYATAVAFDDGSSKAVVITLDLCGLKNQWWVDGCKKMISEYCGISAEAIIITCSHTHTGPIVGYDETSGVDSNKAYDDFLMQCLRDAAYLALNNVCESKFYAAESKCTDVAFSRIYKMKDGSVRTNPGVGNPDIEHPVTDVNETVSLLRIERENADDVIIVNFGTHADTIGGNIVSADWPGFMKKTIENVFPNTVCIFLQGCEGDLNTANVKAKCRRRGLEYSENLGRMVAGSVLHACEGFEEINADSVAFATKKVKVPTNKENDRIDEAKNILELYRCERYDEIPCGDEGYFIATTEAQRIVALENEPDFYEFTLSSMAFGDFVIVGLPGEPFAEIGMRIIKESEFKKTFVCVLADGGEIYFPVRKIYGTYAYEAKSSKVKPGADDILVNGAVELLHKLK